MCIKGLRQCGPDGVELMLLVLEQAGEDLVEGSLPVAEPHFAGGWHGVELLVGQIREPAESRAPDR